MAQSQTQKRNNTQKIDLTPVTQIRATVKRPEISTVDRLKKQRSSLQKEVINHLKAVISGVKGQPEFSVKNRVKSLLPICEEIIEEMNELSVKIHAELNPESGDETEAETE